MSAWDGCTPYNCRNGHKYPNPTLPCRIEDRLCVRCGAMPESVAPQRVACWACGLARTVDDTGCIACDLCEHCTPAEGNCLDCRDMRAEDIAERTRRYAIENETTC